jgi:hypothetical protein
VGGGFGAAPRGGDNSRAVAGADDVRRMQEQLRKAASAPPDLLAMAAENAPLVVVVRAGDASRANAQIEKYLADNQIASQTLPDESLRREMASKDSGYFNNGTAGNTTPSGANTYNGATTTSGSSNVNAGNATVNAPNLTVNNTNALSLNGGSGAGNLTVRNADPGAGGGNFANSQAQNTTAPTVTSGTLNYAPTPGLTTTTLGGTVIQNGTTDNNGANISVNGVGAPAPVAAAAPTKEGQKYGLNASRVELQPNAVVNAATGVGFGRHAIVARMTASQAESMRQSLSGDTGQSAQLLRETPPRLELNVPTNPDPALADATKQPQDELRSQTLKPDASPAEPPLPLGDIAEKYKAAGRARELDAVNQHAMMRPMAPAAVAAPAAPAAAPATQPVATGAADNRLVDVLIVVNPTDGPASAPAPPDAARH